MAALPPSPRRSRRAIGVVALTILALQLVNESAPWWRPKWDALFHPARAAMASPRP